MAAKGLESLQTKHAIQASDLSASFNDAMKRTALPPGDYVPELTSPQGPSTADGKQAMQHLRLVPKKPGFPTLVAGHANHADGKAELRNYEHLDAIHRSRFKRALELDRVKYEEFIGIAKGFFETLRLATTVVGPPPSLVPPPDSGDAPRGESTKVVMAGFLVVTLLALGAALYFGILTR
jgi:hypothetical protein